MSKRQTYDVAKSDNGKRIDIWLAAKLDSSRKKAKELLDAGLVRIAGKKIRIASWELRAGDKVSVQLEQKTRLTKPIFLKVYMDDKHVLVLEKPSGILAVPDLGEPDGNSMLGQVRAFLRRKHGGKASFVEPVHRLDTGTSGVMVFALSKDSWKLRKQFEKHTTTRRYMALVEGRVEDDGRIEAPLEKGKFSGGRKTRVSESENAKEAKTDYRVVERYEDVTLLELTLFTGRTHQIRAHLSYIGHPVIGDRVYGSSYKFPRVALHAHVLGFRHPVGKNKLEFKSDLPPDLKKKIDKLRGI